MKTSPRVTIRQIADQAQVSVGTVSHVLNGTAQVKGTLRARVESAVADLGYIPSQLGRALRKQRTNIIDVIIPDIGNPYFPALVRGIQDTADASDLRVILCNSDNNPQKELGYFQEIHAYRPAGHPRYNRFWWTIGPVFSSDLYGAIAPGMPNVAARMARTFGHINGYAEAVDGAVIYAGAISLAFFERDVKTVLRKAVTLVDASSPYRQCIEAVIAMAEKGATYETVVAAVEDRWRHLYPQSNNAVPNGGIAAASLWYGGGDFWTTVNLASKAAEFSDTDNSAASAIAIIGAMHGMKALPPELIAPLNDRLKGTDNNNVPFTPPVDEKISDLVKRTAAIGEKIVLANGGQRAGETLTIKPQSPLTQPPERFTLGDLMPYWAPGWTLERAGAGGIRGATYLDGEVLATYPRDEARGLVIRRNITPAAGQALSFEVGAEPGQNWELNVYADNKRVHEAMISGADKGRHFTSVRIDLTPFAGQDIVIRLYQRVHNIGNRLPGTAFWRKLEVS